MSNFNVKSLPGYLCQVINRYDRYENHIKLMSFLEIYVDLSTHTLLDL